MASTTTAPSRWMSTGLHSSSARPSAAAAICAAMSARPAGGAPSDCSARSTRGSRAAARSPRRRAARSDAAEADHERRHHAVAARGHDHLHAGRRHALDEHPRGAPWSATSSSTASRRYAVADAGSRAGRARGRRSLLWRRSGAGELQRHRAAAARRTPRAPSSSLVDEPALHDAGRRARAAAPWPRARPASAPVAAAQRARAPRRSPAGAPGRRAAPPARRRSAGRCAARRRPARPPREAPGGRVVEQLGQGRGDHHRHRARGGARLDPLAHRRPALQRRAVEVPGGRS